MDHRPANGRTPVPRRHTSPPVQSRRVRRRGDEPQRRPYPEHRHHTVSARSAHRRHPFSGYAPPMKSRLDHVAPVLRRTEVRYLVVAGSVSVLSWGMVALGLSFGWHYMVATVFSQLAPIPVAFPAYRRYVFESHGRLPGDLFT